MRLLPTQSGDFINAAAIKKLEPKTDPAGNKYFTAIMDDGDHAAIDHDAAWEHISYSLQTLLPATAPGFYEVLADYDASTNEITWSKDSIIAWRVFFESDLPPIAVSSTGRVDHVLTPEGSVVSISDTVSLEDHLRSFAPASNQDLLRFNPPLPKFP